MPSIKKIKHVSLKIGYANEVMGQVIVPWSEN